MGHVEHRAGPCTSPAHRPANVSLTSTPITPGKREWDARRMDPVASPALGLERGQSQVRTARRCDLLHHGLGVYVEERMGVVAMWLSSCRWSCLLIQSRVTFLCLCRVSWAWYLCQIRNVAFACKKPNFLSYDKLHGVDGALIAHTLRVHGACSS